MNCEAILLAAGLSRRMGAVDKLLLVVNGQPLIRRSACLYLDLGLKLTVVAGSDSRAVATALAGLDLQLVTNQQADDGQHTSVRAGLAATPLHAPGVIVALADQPLLTTTDISLLQNFFAARSGASICIPRFAGKRGNPIIFPATFARHLRKPDSLPPRAFIDAHPQHIAWFDAADNHFTRDVDTPADAAELLGTAHSYKDADV